MDAGNASVVATIRESLANIAKGSIRKSIRSFTKAEGQIETSPAPGKLYKFLETPRIIWRGGSIDEREEEEKCELIRRAINESTDTN